MIRIHAAHNIRRLLPLSAVGLAVVAIAIAVSPTYADDTPPTEPPKTAAPKTAPDQKIPMKPAVAIKTLTQNGLKKLKATSTLIPWTLADDAKTCEKLADFSKAAAAHRAAARKVKQVSKETTKDSDALAKAEARYTELKGYSDTPKTIPHRIAVRFRSPQDLMQAIQDDLNNQINTINTLRPKLQGKFVADMPPELKAAIVDWMTARNNLILATIPAKPIFDDLDKQYRALAENADVAAALKSLGKKNRLGSPEFEQDQKAMAESEATAMSGEVPFYREGAYDSVGALLNDSLPIVVRIESVNPQALSWAPTELLIKSGIKIDPAAPSATLTFNGNGKRVVECRQVLVPKLRIGKYVLENLKFLAMPDDAKDLGTQIVNSELKAYDQGFLLALNAVLAEICQNYLFTSKVSPGFDLRLRSN